MVTTARDLVGVGIYTPNEAARYARVSTRTMQRWVFGDRQGDAVIQPQLAASEKLVTFLDFVQTLAIRSVRLRQKGFPLQKIRAACDTATDHYSLRFPLAARDHKIFLFGPLDNPNQCEMVIRFGQDEAGDDRLLQISGRKRGNYVMTQIAEPFMMGLEFGDSPFAERYVAWERNGLTIVMDPHKRLGEPYLPSCGYTALALWEAYVSEGGIERAAKVYGVTTEEVQLAYEYYDHLAGNDAA